MLPLTNPASQYLGKISYSLYLWHFPVVVLIVAVVPQYSAAYWLVGLALIFGLSAASFHLLEDPARRGTWFRHAPGTAPSPRARLAAIRRRLRGHRGCSPAPASSSSGRSSPTRLVARGAGPGRAYPGRSARLHRGGGARSPPSLRELNTGDRVAPLPGAAPRRHRGRLRLLRVSAPADPPVQLREPATGRDPGRPHRRQPCRGAPGGPRATARRAELARHRLHRADVRMAPTPALADVPGTSPDPAGTASRHYAVVIATEIRVSTQAPSPSTSRRCGPSPPPARTSSSSRTIPACRPRARHASTGSATARRAPAAPPSRVAYQDPDRLARGRQRIPGARVVATRRFYCRGAFCPATIGNVLVYRDTAAHVTASYARTVSPYLVEAIERALHGRTD